MKITVIYFTLLLLTIACVDTEKRISKSHFEQLFANNAIKQIYLYPNEARFSLKTAEKEVIYILSHNSKKTFKSDFKLLLQRLENQNKHIEYTLVEYSSDNLDFDYIPYFSGSFSIIVIVLILWSVFNILNSIFCTPADKVIWLLVVVLIPILGPILYIWIGCKQKISKSYL